MGEKPNALRLPQFDIFCWSPVKENKSSFCAHYLVSFNTLNLINDSSVPKATRDAAAAEMKKTWDDKKNIYPHRLRGLMLAFTEADPTPYEKELKPLVEHRDERTKQGAARYLEAIKNGTAAP